MSTDPEVVTRIHLLESFKGELRKWHSANDPKQKEQHRTYINRNKNAVRQQIIEAGCFKTFTMAPPPIVGGGLIYRDADLFDYIFNPPYLTSMIPGIIDMIDETIGVLQTQPKPKPAVTNQGSIKVDVKQGYAFVTMAIDPAIPDLDDVLDAIKEAGKRCGVHAERVDEVETTERITDRILESIRKAEFVICDLTHPRPNVYWEAGYAHGLGKTPVYIAKDGTKLEFDLKDYPVIFFKSLVGLKDRLEKRLRALAEQRAKA